MNETKVLVMLPSPSLRRPKALRKNKSASSLGPINFGAARRGCTGDCYNQSEGVTSPRFSYSFHLHPQLADSQPPSDHDGDCDPMVLGTSSSSVLTRAAGNGAFEATTLYSDHPLSLSKEQRWREDRERPSVRIVGPLPHQCAGHETVFRTTDGKICKPLDETEFWFYKTCLREFPRYQAFVPAWHGCVLLSRKKLLLLIDSLGEDDDVISSSSSSSSSSSDEEEGEMEVQERVRRSRPTTAEPPRERDVLPSSPGTWSLLLSEEFRLKLELEDNLPPSSRVSRAYPYIVLEDLTAGYDFPCTLDIKMGTKDLHHQVSTSTTMGLRIMGMQVYEPQTHTYRQFDKMQGRQLVKETVPHQLAQFVTQTLNSGPILRREVLEVFIQKLEALLAILQQENAVQIQNSSLLLVYEGRVPPTSTSAPAMPCVKADVRMIDFQHVQLSTLSAKPDLRSPTVLSPPTARRPSSSSGVSSSSSSASASSGDEASVGDDMEDATSPAEQGHTHAVESDADGLAWGLRNLISLLQATLARGR